MKCSLLHHSEIISVTMYSWWYCVHFSMKPVSCV